MRAFFYFYFCWYNAGPCVLKKKKKNTFNISKQIFWNVEVVGSNPMLGTPVVLTHIWLMDFSIPINWMSPFQNLGMSGVFFFFFLIKFPVSKQCRPWSDAAFCGIWSWSALFAYVPKNGTPGLYGFTRCSKTVYILICIIPFGVVVNALRDL